MKNIQILSLFQAVLAILHLFLLTFGQNGTKRSLSLPTLSASSLHDFSFKLASKWNEEKNHNYVFAPISIFGTLTALEPALRGESSSQIKRALGLENLTDTNEVEEMIHSVYCPSHNSYKTYRAEKLFVDQSLHLTKSYKNYVKRNPSLAMKKVDFVGSPERILHKINGFVKRRTNGEGKKLLSEDMITSSTMIFLAEAFTLEAKWISAFDPSQTKLEEFTLRGGRKIKVPTMQSVEQKCYINSLSHEFSSTGLLIIPFKDSALTLNIIVPSNPGNFEPLEQAGLGNLIRNHLDGITRTNRNRIMFRECTVHLPRFEVESHMGDLTEVLKQLGITDVFSDTEADFTGLVRDHHKGLVSIKDVVHHAKISIGEHGMRSSAATGVGIGYKSLVLAYINRPFMFIVRHQATGAILLHGRVMHP